MRTGLTLAIAIEGGDLFASQRPRVGHGRRVEPQVAIDLTQFVVLRDECGHYLSLIVHLDAQGSKRSSDGLHVGRPAKPRR